MWYPLTQNRGDEVKSVVPRHESECPSEFQYQRLPELTSFLYPRRIVSSVSEIAASYSKAIHFNTYGGNPVSSTVGKAVLEVRSRTTQSCVGRSGVGPLSPAPSPLPPSPFPLPPSPFPLPPSPFPLPPSPLHLHVFPQAIG